jgi:hypothetical protein
MTPPKTRATLREGSQGPSVALLQGWLNNMPTEFQDLVTDGIFGPKTAAKVREFQKVMEIAPDAIVGPVTWAKINDALLAIGIPGVLPGSTGAQYNFEFTDNDRPKPGWHENKAWDIFSIRGAIVRHNRSALDVNTILAIFFEESLFCNIAQPLQSGNAGPGRGFGQMETRNPDKQEYYAWAGLPTDPPKTPKTVRGEKVSAMMLGSKEECVRIHVGWYNWLKEERGLDMEGTLGAQVGEHVAYKPLFRRGGVAIGNAFMSRRRIDMINALNLARAESPKENGIPWPRFGKFWRFIIPDWSLILGF